MIYLHIIPKLRLLIQCVIFNLFMYVLSGGIILRPHWLICIAVVTCGTNVRLLSSQVEYLSGLINEPRDHAKRNCTTIVTKLPRRTVTVIFELLKPPELHVNTTIHIESSISTAQLGDRVTTVLVESSTGSITVSLQPTQVLVSGKHRAHPFTIQFTGEWSQIWGMVVITW